MWILKELIAKHDIFNYMFMYMDLIHYVYKGNHQNQINVCRSKLNFKHDQIMKLFVIFHRGVTKP